MQMVARGETGLAGSAEDLALLERIALLDVDRAQVAVEREEPEAVIEDDGVAVDAQIPGKNYRAAVRRLDRIALGDREVVAEVVGLVDRLVVVDVGALVGEVRFHLRVGELDEGAFPQDRRRGLLRDRRNPVVVFLPQAPVDREEDLLLGAVAHIGGAQQGRHRALDEAVGDEDRCSSGTSRSGARR
jgi:hypothetical protein